ncbi:hypothetical protein ACFOEY_19735 [Paracandidimonas soli]|uniref:hypothetical protein n=1 Tax=Paracandidimonas soli TaxID=1917182 RepID=UPI00360CB706
MAYPAYLDGERSSANNGFLWGFLMDAGLIVRGGGSIVQIDSQYNNLGLRGALTVSLPGGRVTSGSYVGGRTVEASFNWVKGDLLFIRSTTPVHAYYHNMIPGKIVLRQPIDAAAGSAVVYVVGKRLQICITR